MLMNIFCTLVLLGAPLVVATAEEAPAAKKTTDVIELHGSLAGNPFWARLLAPDAHYGGHRILQVVYTPPARDQVDGARLSDCPFVLLDDAYHVIGWNGRDTASTAYALVKPSCYKVSRDLEVGEDTSKHSEGIARTVPSELAWDLRLAPVLLAIAWHAGSSGSEPLVDLFGPRWQEHLRISWKGDHVDIAGVSWQIGADAVGLLHSISDSEGNPILVVDGRP
jgi:hypothetical protein